MNNETEQDKNKHDRDTLVETIRSRAHTFFNERLSELFDKADDVIYRKGEAARSVAEQNILFEFMNALRRQRAAIKARFASEMSRYLLPLSDTTALPRSKKSSEDGDFQLGLMDQDEMDEMVILTTLSNKAAMELQEQLSHLQTRLAALAAETEQIFRDNALVPAHICDAFRTTLADTDFASEHKLILYQQFGKEVTSQLKQLYDDINQLMINQDIVPNIKFKHGISRGLPRHPELRQPGERWPEDTPAAQGGRSGGGGYGAGAGAGGAAGYGGGDGGAPGAGAYGTGSSGGASGGYSGGQGGDSAGHSTGASPAGGGSGPASGAAQAFEGPQYGDQAGAGAPQHGTTGGGDPQSPSGPAAPGPGGQRYSAGLPVEQIQARIRSFVGALPTEAGTAGAGEGAGTGGGGGGGFYTQQDVVDALTSMQAQTRIDPEQEHHFDAAAIKNAVLSTIGQHQGGAVTRRVNQISEKTIDFIKLIFDAIIEDASITDAIKTLILSLQIPVIKTAMLDEEFFIDDQHPSRQLLDKLAEAGVGINSHHDLVYIELERIIKKLLKDFVDNIEAFEVALKEVIELFDETSQQAEQQQEDTRKELIHAHARNVVLAEIRKITLGKKLPISVHALVLKAWPTLMFNHYLKHGKSNDEWIELLMMLTTITESIQPVKSIQELEALGISHDDIVNAVREKLKGYHKPREVIDKIIEDLQATYAELLETKDLPEQSEQPPEQEEPEQTHRTSFEQQQEEVDQVKQKLAHLPDMVRPGSWFKVYNGEDSIARRLKLGIILVQDATLAFVDYKGNVILEKDAGEFAEELESGRSELIMQHSVFDRALSSALSSVEQVPV